MKMKSLVLLAMAIGCGLVAMLGVRQVLSGDKGAATETEKVLVAVTNIMPGQPLDDTNVAFKEWPKDRLPQGAVTSQEQYIERSLRVAVVPNEVIMVAKLNEKGVFGGSSEIPAGLRVATVPVTATKTHSGLILRFRHLQREPDALIGGAAEDVHAVRIGHVVGENGSRGVAAGHVRKVVQSLQALQKRQAGGCLTRSEGSLDIDLRSDRQHVQFG